MKVKSFKNILYVVAPGSTCKPTLERAVALAENNLASLTVVEVLVPVRKGMGGRDGLPDSASMQAAIKTERQRTLDSLIEPYRQRLDIQHEVLIGTGFLQIIRAVLRNDYDLVIKPAEDPRFLERIFGSDDMQLLRECPCPVWLMKPAEKLSYDNIVVALDFDTFEPESAVRDLNREIIELCSSLAIAEFADLHLVHAWDVPEAGFVQLWVDNPEEAASAMTQAERARRSRGMDRLRQIMQQHLGPEAYDYLAPSFHLRQGSPVDVIPALASQLQADLVVMGTVARTGIPGLIIGNTAESILDQLHCSVLTIKPPGFESPVVLERSK